MRSSSAVLVCSQNENREWIYSQQQTDLGGGFSGQAFTPALPAHRARARRRRAAPTATSPSAGDNNAWMAQLLMLGTNFVNFIGRYVWVGEGDARLRGRRGHRARRAAGGDRQQPARAGLSGRVRARTRRAARRARSEALPPRRRRASRCSCAASTSTPPRARAGCASTTSPTSTTRASPSASSSAPVSPLGQRLYVETKDATAVALPTTHGRSTRRGSRDPENQEQPIHPLYGYAYVADREEGLVLVEPRTRCSTATRGTTSSKRRRDLQPRRRARRARPRMTIAGTLGYVRRRRGLVVVDLDDPLQPRVAGAGRRAAARRRGPSRSSSATPSCSTPTGSRSST